MKDHITPILEELRKAREELETLRASNKIKQANIELLEAENYQLSYSILGYNEDVKLRDEKVMDLEAENAKLIAERDKWMQYSAAVNKVSAFKSDDLNNLQGYIYELTSERDALLAERDRLQTKFDLLVKDTEKLQESYNQLRVDRFKIFHEDECWIYDENEDNNLHSLVCPVVIKASVLQSVLQENKRLLAEREAMMKQEPVAFISPSGDLRKSSQAKYAHEWGAQFVPLYASPLPAQQIPEGYAEALRNIMCGSSCDITGNDTCCMPKIRELYQLLSASQPKGDV